MKKVLVIFLCLWIAFLPAMGHAGAGTTIPGFYKSLAPPLPKPKPPNATGTAQPELELTVAPKSKPKTASLSPPHRLRLLPTLFPWPSGQFREDHIRSGHIEYHSRFEPGQNGCHTERAEGDSKLDFFQYRRQATGSSSTRKNSNWVCLEPHLRPEPSQIFGKLRPPAKYI